MKRSVPTRFVLLPSICCAIAWLNAQTNAQLLESPCRRVFGYDSDNAEHNKWYGIINLVPDIDSNELTLTIVLDRPALQLGDGFDEIDTDDGRTFRATNRHHRLIANIPLQVRFYVRYDPREPTPRLERLRFNNKQICPEVEAESGYTNPGDFINPDEYSDEYSPALQSNSNDDANVECGTVAIQPSPLIILGLKTKPGQYPWHTALYHSEGGSLNYQCGGSLISRHHVITVAHCVSKQGKSVLDPGSLLIYLGKYYLNGWSNPSLQTLPVSAIIRHPQYNPDNYRDDIAVIKLLQPAKFTDFVRPICLWEGDTDINRIVGEYGAVVGWGYDETDRLSDELNVINMPVVSKEVCIYSSPEFFSQYTTINSYCAGSRNGSSVCNGDSGGGMVFERSAGDSYKKAYYLRGLVSVSVKRKDKLICDASHYVVFTDVAKYLDFIKEAMRK